MKLMILKLVLCFVALVLSSAVLGNTATISSVDYDVLKRVQVLLDVPEEL